MKYFTKYLPVEGELKIGEMAKLANDPADAHIANADCLSIGCDKVKLFLCSRDNPEEPVGMINPKDTWVKEGDEFSEDEISRAFVGDRLKTGTVQIKCRCCGKYSPL